MIALNDLDSVEAIWRCAWLSFKFLRWLWKLPVFSIIYNYPSRQPPFSSRYHLSCPIIVDSVRLLQLKSLIYPVAHLTLHTATGWHLQKPPICCHLTHRDGKLFSAQRGGLHLILSQITLSVFLSLFSIFNLQLYFPVIVSLSLANFSSIILHASFTRLKGFHIVDVKWHSEQQQQQRRVLINLASIHL